MKKQSPQQQRRGYGGVVKVAIIALCVAVLPSVLRRTHLAPAFIDGLLPPHMLYGPLLTIVGTLEQLMRNLTPPNLYLWRNLMGYLHTTQLHTVARLGIADLLVAGPQSSLQLAKAVTPCESEPDAASPRSCDAVAARITRLMRATSAYGVFTEAQPQTWAHTPSSRFLVSPQGGQPNSLKASALLFGGTQFLSMIHAVETVVTGTSSFQLAHGAEFWDFYTSHPDDHAVFDQTMQEIGALGANDVAISHDFAWERYTGANGTVVDVGGGLGDMMTHILLRLGGGVTSAGGIRGAVFDLPSVVQRSQQVWTQAYHAVQTSSSASSSSIDQLTLRRGSLWGTGRVRFLAGSFFEPDTIPTALTLAPAALNADACTAPPVAYALRDIVHDWPDSDVIRMLTALGQGMRRQPEGEDKKGSCASDRLMLVARVVQPGAGFVESQGTNDADWLMLANFGSTAGERTLDHFLQLLAASGLALEADVPVRGWYHVLVAKRA